MAVQIRATLAEQDPLVLCTMTGGVILAGQLLPRLDFPLQLDYLHATRYRGATQGGELHWIHQPTTPLQGRSVLVLDDILDAGHTLAAILAYCRAAQPQSLHTAVLARKEGAAQVDLIPDFCGLVLPNRYVFGMGMDYHDYLRNAPGIYAVRGM
jgi:hypoxanthine phosphoribosyltransferase